MLLICLFGNFSFYATGDHYQSLAQFFGVSKKSVSTAVTKVTDALFQLKSDYILFPTAQELPAIMNGFYQISIWFVYELFLDLEGANAENYWMHRWDSFSNCSASKSS